MRKKLLLVLLAIVSVISMAFALVSCGDTTTSKNDGWGNVFTVETAYAHAQELGYEGTLQQFLNSIKGEDGKDGVGVKAITINADNKLIITLSNDQEIDLGVIKGKDGKDGKDGVGVKAITINADNKLIITLSNDQEIDLGVIKGKDGKDGEDGVGVKTAVINEDGELVITLTDDKEINVGVVKDLSSTPPTSGEYYTEGLHFILNPDKQSYALAGIGMAEDFDIYVPSTHKGKPVTTITDRAFNGEQNPHSVSLHLPKSIKYIGDENFYDSYIGDIYYEGTIADWLKVKLANAQQSHPAASWNDRAFYVDGQNLNVGGGARIVIPDTVTKINEYAFYDCDGIISITIGSNVQTIAFEAFWGCSNLIEIYNLSPHLTITAGSADNGEIGYYAKDVYTSLSTPSKLLTIDQCLFYKNDDEAKLLSMPTVGDVVFPTTDFSYSVTYFPYAKTTSVIISNSVTNLPSFYSSENLTSVTIGTAITTIPQQTFRSCYALETVIFKDNSQLQSIGYEAFSGCKALKTVDFGENSQLQSIGYAAFSGCRALENFDIPDTVTYIGADAFWSSPLIEDENNLRYFKNWLVEYGGDYSSFSDITTITIRANTTGIIGDAFSYFSNLTDIYFQGSRQEWLNVKKSTGWISSYAEYTIHCSDGDIQKGQTTIEG